LFLSGNFGDQKNVFQVFKPVLMEANEKAALEKIGSMTKWDWKPLLDLMPWIEKRIVGVFRTRCYPLDR
jgi:hypothetical protein